MAETEQKPVEQNQTQAPAPAAPAQSNESPKVASTSEKQQYTFPEEGVVIEATSLEDAVKQLNAKQKDEN